MFKRKGSVFFRAGRVRGVGCAGGSVVMCDGSETNIKNIKHTKPIERQRFPCYVWFYVFGYVWANIKHKTLPTGYMLC
jgi:hypothetical protein